MTIVVAGAGAFGTALAIALAGPVPVTLLGRDEEAMTTLNHTRRHAKHLPNVELPEGIAVTADSACLVGADIVLVCIPTQQLVGWLEQHAALLSTQALIACCKGIDLRSLKTPAETISQKVPDAVSGVLTGPSFAVEIADGLPTALTLACADGVRAQELQVALTRRNLRLYRSADVVGATLGGALKNVIAIAAGVCVGAGLGESARAALVTRGFAEMQKLAQVLGAQRETLMGLSGLGDLILTCASEKSRNYSFGIALGQGRSFDSKVTVEGSATAQAAVQLAQSHGLDMPVTEAIHALVSGRSTVSASLNALLARPLRQE